MNKRVSAAVAQIAESATLAVDAKAKALADIDAKLAALK